MKGCPCQGLCSKLGKPQADVVKKWRNYQKKPVCAACKQQVTLPPPPFHCEFGACSFLSQVRNPRLWWLFVQVAQVERERESDLGTLT